MTFYLGTHVARWLHKEPFRGVPLFVSARRLRDQRYWPPRTTRYALDSGGFTELSMYGKWMTSPHRYVEEINLWRVMIGEPDFCSPQDWMCESIMLEKTGKTVEQHQQLTVRNYLHLKEIGGDIPFIPVLQGWTFGDYMRHVEDYRKAGVHLETLPTVGVGSICRRQDTTMAEDLMRELHGMGIQTHGFGFKIKGLANCARYMKSADSMAWSFAARRSPVMPGCTHKTCANCHKFALNWLPKAHRAIDRGMLRCDARLF